MKKIKDQRKDFFIMMIVLALSFGLIICIQRFFITEVIAPIIFVLAVFIVALTTKGYIWGIVTACLSVVAVNFAFTFPYFKFSVSISENIFSGIVMLFVAAMTSTLTTKIKKQERLRREAEKEKVRADLLRAVSHDIRTPLTTIYGSSSTVMENYDMLSKEQQMKLLAGIKEEAEWLIRMVENLLSVTRIDGGNVSVIKTPTVLEELIDSVLMKFKKRYHGQNIDVKMPDSLISIPMDAILIEQVLLNFLENAVLHAEGMTKVSMEVFIDGNNALFEISDNGCGIPEDKVEAMFAGYGGSGEFVADGSKQSLGIGLSVCAAIIKAHDGELRVKSSEYGTVIGFSLKMEDT